MGRTKKYLFMLDKIECGFQKGIIFRDIKIDYPVIDLFYVCPNTWKFWHVVEIVLPLILQKLSSPRRSKPQL